MKEVTGNIWDYHMPSHHRLVIPTNGFLKADGTCVMGRGLALQASRKYPELPRSLGVRIRGLGNRVYEFSQWGLITFPVKHNWWEAADPKLIIKSVEELLGVVDKDQNKKAWVYIPRVGCGNGGLDWALVKPLLAESLDDRFTLVSSPSDV